MTLFLAHSVILLAISWLAAGRLHRLVMDRLLATTLLVWGNIVVTSLLLSGLHRLGEPAWFFRTSLLLAAITWLLLRLVPPVVAAAPASDAAGSSRPSLTLLGAFFLTLLPIAYVSIRIAATYEPNNYDTLAYHLPRAMYYLGQNSLAHFQTGNPRQIYFPFNYNLLQLFGLVYSPPVQVLNFFNLAAWAAAGLAVYRLCRLSGFGAGASLVATWLSLTSTQVLAQGTATTNDLPTAAGLLCTLVYILRWRETRHTRHALLAGLAAGLTAGSKLTVIFFAPAAGLLLLVLGWRQWRSGEFRAFLTSLRAWIAPSVLAFALASPFALINLAQKGEWINKTYDFTLNRPFSVACVLQTSEAYLVQLFLEPLHRFTYDLKVTEQLNHWGSHAFFPHWNENYAFSPLYLFPPDLNEDHVWFGFTGPVILLAALFSLWRCRQRQAPGAWLAWLGLGWFATYFLLNKWSLYNQRYFVPAILVMSPGLAALLEAGWTSDRFRRLTRSFATGLALCSLWLAGIYFFQNTSRPYGPLWEGNPAPPALPALPSLMTQRLSAQPRINIHSTDGNERIFLLMGLGRRQRFTAFDPTIPDAYNVYSEWGFPRKVAYTNIEQLSSYTVVEIPTKRTAGVEFLGTIGQGQPALDYYGLIPHPENEPAASGNRNVLVELYYAPREPNRYMFLRLKVAGLNAPDHARLRVGVDYTDGTSESLAVFTASGETRASVTRPFHRFTVRVEDQGDGGSIGAVDIPHVFRDRPPEEEAPENPTSIFADELIAAEPKTRLTTSGLASPEGPYPQWDLPVIRWVKEPVLRLEIPAMEGIDRLALSFNLRLQARESASLDVRCNGELVKSYSVAGRTTWLNQRLELPAHPGTNVIEFRNVTVSNEPDWLDYLERYPDVKNYVVSLHIPLEQGAREHYDTFGKHETRVLHHKRRTETLPNTDQLYYVFRSLRVEGFRKP
jgi:4-amino-4-deoxy-L-arabinose transferase-like glycosyltransferase